MKAGRVVKQSLKKYRKITTMWGKKKNKMCVNVARDPIP